MPLPVNFPNCCFQTVVTLDTDVPVNILCKLLRKSINEHSFQERVENIKEKKRPLVNETNPIYTCKSAEK